MRQGAARLMNTLWDSLLLEGLLIGLDVGSRWVIDV